MTANDFLDISLPIQSLMTCGKTKLTLPLIILLLRKRIHERKKQNKTKHQTKPLLRQENQIDIIIWAAFQKQAPLYICAYVPLGNLLWNKLPDLSKTKKNTIKTQRMVYAHIYGENITVIVCCKHIVIRSGLCWLNIPVHLHWEFEISYYCLKDIHVLLSNTPKILTFPMEAFSRCSGFRCYLMYIY